GTREAVDRLVVVADGAELVPAAEPELQKRLLQQVDVLVLVDREASVALAHGGDGPLVRLVHPNRELEQVLEVDEPSRGLAPLVVAEDSRHQVRGNRRLVLAEAGAVPVRMEAPGL